MPNFLSPQAISLKYLNIETVKNCKKNWKVRTKLLGLKDWDWKVAIEDFKLKLKGCDWRITTEELGLKC